MVGKRNLNLIPLKYDNLKIISKLYRELLSKLLLKLLCKVETNLLIKIRNRRNLIVVVKVDQIN